MRCHSCQHVDTKVIESRDAADGDAIRRRRECDKCQYRFTTYERLERPQLVVVKSSGAHELFSREKLLAGLYRACEKTTVSSVQLERLVAEIEEQLYECGDNEVPTKTIGGMVMDRLALVNEVAYVRFASVYRRFKDIASFERELTHIREHKAASPVKG